MKKLPVLLPHSLSPFALERAEAKNPRKDKRYVVHSMFLTVQGEGLHAGRRAVFIRLSGCNVWTGREEDRKRDAENHSGCAAICDTQFRGVNPSKDGGRYTRETLVQMALALWGADPSERFVVFTGGEPSLQLDAALVQEFRSRGFYTAVETNGSGPIPANIHWVTLSPKFPVPIQRRHYDEMKLLSIFLTNPTYRNWAAQISATFRWVQPTEVIRDDYGIEPKNTAEMKRALEFVMNTPGWRMGLQQHKTWAVE